MAQISDPKSKRKVRPQPITQKILRRSISAGIYIFFVFICAFTLNIVRSWLPRLDSFCTTQDEIYQVISNNAETWLTDYPALNYPLPSFSLPGNNRTYYVNADRDLPEAKISLLYVTTGTDLSLNGSAGYLYVPSGTLTSRFWLDNYWIRHLHQNIYCYRIK